MPLDNAASPEVVEAPPFCEPCHQTALLPEQEKAQQAHWRRYTLTSLLDHLRKQFGQNDRAISAIVGWWRSDDQKRRQAEVDARYPEYVDGDEVEPDRAEERRKRREWFGVLHCQTPEEAQALAAHCLSARAQASVAEVCRIWGNAVRSKERVDPAAIAKAATPEPGPAPHWTERGE